MVLNPFVFETLPSENLVRLEKQLMVPEVSDKFKYHHYHVTPVFKQTGALALLVRWGGSQGQ